MRQNYMLVKRQQGVALIVILMLLAIMTTVAGTMSERLFTQFKRSGNQVNYQQAYWYSLGVEALAVVGIEQSFKDGDTINLNQPWAIKNQVYPLDYGQASGRIVDKQACFNINVLSRVTHNATSVTRPYLLRTWQHLLETLEVEPYQAEVIADSTWEYIRTSKTVQSQTGVGDSTYESMQPAYTAPHHWMVDSSELRAVYQMGGDIYQKIKPMVCALPSDDWRLNVNTIEPAQAPLLVAMFSPNLSEENALALIAARPVKGWTDINDFLNESEIAGLSDASKTQAKAYLGVDSSFFELDTQILVDQSRIRLRSLLSSQDRKTVTVVRRRFGGISERVVSRSAE